MARKMALAGVDPSELQPRDPIEKPKTFRQKWDNFWYHYKVVFWIVTVLVVIVATLTVKSLTENPADYDIVAVTGLALLPNEEEALEEYLASIGADLDGDGKVEVAIENLVPTFDSDGGTGIGYADQQSLITHISTGEKMLYIFDERSYKAFLASISDVTSDEYMFFAPLEIADEHYDAENHYWRMIGDAAFADCIPETLESDLIIGVRAPEGTAGKHTSTELYEQGKALIEAISR